MILLLVERGGTSVGRLLFSAPKKKSRVKWSGFRKKNYHSSLGVWTTTTSFIQLLLESFFGVVKREEWERLCPALEGSK